MYAPRHLGLGCGSRTLVDDDNDEDDLAGCHCAGWLTIPCPRFSTKITSVCGNFLSRLNMQEPYVFTLISV